jgi:hypothetical protein
MLHEERNDCVSTEKSHLCTKNPIYVFPEMKLRGLVPNSYIHVFVSYLYIPRIGLPILEIYKNLTDT